MEEARPRQRADAEHDGHGDDEQDLGRLPHLPYHLQSSESLSPMGSSALLDRGVRPPNRSPYHAKIERSRPITTELISTHRGIGALLVIASQRPPTQASYRSASRIVKSDFAPS